MRNSPYGGPLTRRDLLRRSATGAAAMIWTVPMVQVLDLTKAAAAPPSFVPRNTQQLPNGRGSFPGNADPQNIGPDVPKGPGTGPPYDGPRGGKK